MVGRRGLLAAGGLLALGLAMCRGAEAPQAQAGTDPADQCLDRLASAEGLTLLDNLNNGALTYATIAGMADWARWLWQAGRNGWMGHGFSARDSSGLAPTLSSGQAAMALVWDTWFQTDFADGLYTQDDFELMPVFMGTSPQGTYEGGNLNMMLVPQEARHAEEALGLLGFCARSDVYNRAFQGVATMPCFNGQTTHSESPKVTKVRSSVAAHLRPSTAQPRIDGYTQADTAREALRLLRNEIQPGEFLDNLDRDRLQNRSG